MIFISLQSLPILTSVLTAFHSKESRAILTIAVNLMSHSPLALWPYGLDFDLWHGDVIRYGFKMQGCKFQSGTFVKCSKTRGNSRLRLLLLLLGRKWNFSTYFLELCRAEVSKQQAAMTLQIEGYRVFWISLFLLSLNFLT